MNDAQPTSGFVSAQAPERPMKILPQMRRIVFIKKAS